MKKKPLIVTAVVILLAAFIVIGIIGKNKEKLIEVPVFTVASQDFTREVSSNGEIVSRKNAQVVSLVSGSVSRVLAETGDQVAQGQILAELNKDDMELQYQNAAAALESARRLVREELLSLRSAHIQAQTSYRRAKRDYERTEELFKIGSAGSEERRLAADALEISSQTLKAAAQRLNFREGRDPDDPRETPSLPDDRIIENSTEVRQALLQVNTLASTLEHYTFRAPLTGVVTLVAVEEGGVTAPGAVVAAVHNLEALEVVSSIDEVDLSFISLGQKVKIESDSFIGREIFGEVTKIDPIIRRVAESRICEIRVAVTEDPQNLARIGAGCSIYITVETKTGVPAVPVEAYFLEDGKKFVYVLEETGIEGIYQTKKQEVETGILGIESVEITEGLSAGTLITASRIAGLETGMDVKIKTEESAGGDTE